MLKGLWRYVRYEEIYRNAYRDVGCRNKTDPLNGEVLTCIEAQLTERQNPQ